LKRLPYRPRCDTPDFEKISAALDAQGPVSNFTAHSKILRQAYQDYCRRASNPYSWRPFCQALRLWQKEQADLAALDKEHAEIEASETYWRARAAPKARVLVLAGECTGLAVKGGELECYGDAGSVWFAPGHSMPVVIVLAGWGGSVTLAALRFCRERHIALSFLDWLGGPSSFAGPAPKRNAVLVRKQVLASSSGKARAAIARAIIKKKIEHARATHRLDARDADPFMSALATARTAEAVMTVEASAAKHYWTRFQITLDIRAKGHLPGHWQTFAGRPSGLGKGPRRATSPFNAMLNYAYAITVSRLSAMLHGAGACLSIGFLHRDLPGRESLSYDAIEPLRPLIDARVFKFAREHRFSTADFIRLNSGEVPLAPGLVKAFGQGTALPQADIAQAAEFMIGLIGKP
jgi:CRISP-associated protein Cas1